MRLKQNVTLLLLIIILLSVIASINTLDIISVPAESPSGGSEIKVSRQQLPQHRINIEIIWDASNSMWGEIENKDKIIFSKAIIKKIIKELPEEIYLGLRVFGSKENKKNNSFLAVPIDRGNKQKILNFIEQIKPAGKSPLSMNLIKAGKDLVAVDGKKHILLFTDGKDTGEIMPSTVIKDLSKQNIRTHIIQIGNINKVNQLRLKNLAAIGNGKYFTYFEKNQVVQTINLD